MLAASQPQPQPPHPFALALPSIMYTPEPAGPQRYTPNLSPPETTLCTSTPDIAQSSRDSSDVAPERSSSQATDHPMLFDPYFRQYCGPGINAGPHLAHSSVQAPRHIPPYPTSSDPAYTMVEGTGTGPCTPIRLVRPGHLRIKAQNH
jgi:hypothetical protein